MATATDRQTVVFALDDFREAFTAVARATPSRTTFPALQSVKLELTGDPARKSILSATNQEIWLQRRLPLMCYDVGSALVPVKVMSEILRLAEGEELELSFRDSRCKVQSGSASWQMNTADVDEFPSPPEFKADSYVEVASDRLRLAIRRTVREARPGMERGQRLDGLELEPMMLALGLTSCNGRSVAHQKVEAVQHGPFAPGPLPIVPADALRLLAGLLEDDDSAVRVSVPNSNWARFETDDTVLWTRLCEGRFIDWRGHVDGLPKPKGSFTAGAGDLRKTIARAAVALDEATRAVSLWLDGDGLTVQSESERSDAESHLEVEWTAESLLYCLDPQYLLPMLQTLGDQMPVTVSFWDDKRPLRVTTEDGFLGFCAPIEKKKGPA